MKTIHILLPVFCICLLPIKGSADLWTPSQLNSMVGMWLDASDASSITQDGSNRVSAWNDQSANGFHATRAGVNGQPLYDASRVGGLGAIRFGGEGNAGDDDWLEATINNAQGGLFSTAGADFFAVNHSLSANKGSSDGWLWQSNGGANTDRPRVNVNGGGILTTLTQDFARSGSYGLNGVSTSGDLLLPVDEDQILHAHATLNWEAQDQGLLVVGNRGDNRPWDGYVGEMLWVNENLSGVTTPTQFGDSDATQTIEGYLAWKWGLESNLPGSHPFANTAPMNAIPEPGSGRLLFLGIAAVWSVRRSFAR
jgi:hypothetical protein